MATSSLILHSAFRRSAVMFFLKLAFAFVNSTKYKTRFWSLIKVCHLVSIS